MIRLAGTGLAPADVVAVARRDAGVELADDAREAMAESAAIVERLAASAEPAYGVSTGFGSLATTPIPAEQPRGAAARPDPLTCRRVWGSRSSGRSCGR